MFAGKVINGVLSYRSIKSGDDCESDETCYATIPDEGPGEEIYLDGDTPTKRTIPALTNTAILEMNTGLTVAQIKTELGM